MWASLYEELVGRVYWYLCFSEEKGHLEDDLMHAILTHRHLVNYPFDDAERQKNLIQTLEDIITVFSKRVQEFKEKKVVAELGTEDCPYRLFPKNECK